MLDNKFLPLIFCLNQLICNFRICYLQHYGNKVYGIVKILNFSACTVRLKALLYLFYVCIVLFCFCINLISLC
jgi:hypothetical protein